MLLFMGKSGKCFSCACDVMRTLVVAKEKEGSHEEGAWVKRPMMARGNGATSSRSPATLESYCGGRWTFLGRLGRLGHLGMLWLSQALQLWCGAAALLVRTRKCLSDQRAT